MLAPPAVPRLRQREFVEAVAFSSLRARSAMESHSPKGPGLACESRAARPRFQSLPLGPELGRELSVSGHCTMYLHLWLQGAQNRSWVVCLFSPRGSCRKCLLALKVISQRVGSKANISTAGCSQFVIRTFLGFLPCTMNGVEKFGDAVIERFLWTVIASSQRGAEWPSEVSWPFSEEPNYSSKPRELQQAVLAGG